MTGLDFFRKPSEEEIKEAEYVLLDAIDLHTLYVPPRNFWDRNSWLPVDACHLDEKVAKTALTNLLKKGHVAYHSAYDPTHYPFRRDARSYYSTKYGKEFLELESTMRIGISELEKNFVK